MLSLVTGGTGSIGNVLVRHLLERDENTVLVFSRDETKQYEMRAEIPDARLQFQVGDIRDIDAVREAVRGANTIFHCAAMKHVPTCEKAPLEAVLTNIAGARNLIHAIQRDGDADVVVVLSTDKACKPTGVMGHTKAIMEQMFVQEARQPSGHSPHFITVRLGNVVPSRGSVFPFFQRLAAEGKPLPVTSPNMTRFLIPLHDVTSLMLGLAYNYKGTGDIIIPGLKAAYIQDIAAVLIGDGESPIVYTSPRPGEKIHELLFSEEEAPRVVPFDAGFILRPVWSDPSPGPFRNAYCSRHRIMPIPELSRLLESALCSPLS